MRCTLLVFPPQRDTFGLTGPNCVGGWICVVCFRLSDAMQSRWAKRYVAFQQVTSPQRSISHCWCRQLSPILAICDYYLELCQRVRARIGDLIWGSEGINYIAYKSIITTSIAIGFQSPAIFLSFLDSYHFSGSGRICGSWYLRTRP